MVIFKCDRCGADIPRMVAPNDLDNRIRTSEKGVSTIVYDVTKQKFDESGKWLETEYIHLCRKCTSELHAFIKDGVSPVPKEDPVFSEKLIGRSNNAEEKKSIY